jgi:FixJ family two-component response regulator
MVESRWSIVLVDDDDSLRRALARTMRLAGYEVLAFRSADEFTASGVSCGQVCLVLDINLPGTSGIELRRAMAAKGWSPPTIFITALDRHDTEAGLETLAPVAVLYKPFRNDELMSAIERACRP